MYGENARYQYGLLLENLKVHTTIGMEIHNHLNYDTKSPLELLDEISNTDSLETIDKAIATIAYQYGFQYYSMFSAISSKEGCLHLHSVAQGDLEYMVYYRRKDYFSCDPMLRLSRESSLPFVWNASSYKNKIENQLMSNERDVVDDSIGFGMVQAINLPFHTPNKGGGLLRFIRMSAKPMTEQEVYFFTSEVSLLCTTIFEKQCDLLLPSINTQAPFDVALTFREKEILQWIAFGKTPSQVGGLLGISDNTVSTHLKNTRRKLKVCNITHAVAKAIVCEIISV